MIVFHFCLENFTMLKSHVNRIARTGMSKTAGISGMARFENHIVPHIWRYKCGEFAIRTPLLCTLNQRENIEKCYVIPKFSLIAPFDSIKAHKESEDARKLSYTLNLEKNLDKTLENLKKKGMQFPIRYVCSGHYNIFKDEYVVTSFDTEYCDADELEFEPIGNYGKGGWLSCYRDGVKQIVQPWSWPFELPNSHC